jgi:hypothetical protein
VFDTLLPHCFHSYGERAWLLNSAVIFFAADAARQQMNMTFKSIVREKRFDAVCVRVSACSLALGNPKFTINFCHIRNMSKYEIEFPSRHLMNCAKIIMASFSLAISRRFRAASPSVSWFSFKTPITCVQRIII